MIQSQFQNPCPNIFSKNPIKIGVKRHIHSFICSLNKSLFGVYQSWENSFRSRFFNQLKGKVILFQKKEEQWTEYFRMDLITNYPAILLCFINNGTQLLFYQSQLNRIESLTINKHNIFGLYSYISGNIQIFFKLPSDVISAISSNDQKMILIKCEAKYFLLDVISKTIIVTYQTRRYQEMSFFDNTYLIQARVLQPPIQEVGGEVNPEELIYEQEKKIFYNIINQKAEKILYFCKQTQLKDDYRNDNIYQLNSNRIGCFYYLSQGNQALMVFNLINFKFIRKVKLVENYNHLSFIFLGISQNYALHSFINNNQRYLHILDLLGLNFEIIDLNFEIIHSDPEMPEPEIFKTHNQINFRNQILMVKDLKLQKTQFWPTNL